MSPAEINAIVNRHVDEWSQSDLGDKPLRQHIFDAITEALAIDYEQRCLTGTPPHDINNPQPITHTAADRDQE